MKDADSFGLTHCCWMPKIQVNQIIKCVCGWKDVRCFVSSLFIIEALSWGVTLDRITPSPQHKYPSAMPGPSP